ncbi:MAG: PAS domain S-box protein [Deltaproteobacteria bacterium]|nr:PAS domain S-box protein [Deltaproteobacteria bacterium]
MKARSALVAAFFFSAIVSLLFSAFPHQSRAEKMPVSAQFLAELTQQERDALRKNPVLTVITDGDMAPYGFVDEQGRYIGVMPDIAARLEELLGIRIKFRPMAYADIVEHVRQGTAEAATLVDAFDVPYDQHYLMTDEVLFMPYALFVRKDSDLAAHPQETVSGKTIALITGWDLKNPSLDSLRGNSFVFGDSYFEAITLVLRGKADAFFDVHPATNYILAKNFIQDLIPIKVYHEGYSAAFFVRKELSELFSVLQKALGAISREERMGLLKKWNAFMADAAFRFNVLDLGPEERTWLKNHPVIRVGIDADRVPLEFVDSDGNLQGLSIDYLQRFEKILGIRFDMMSDRAWHEYFDMAVRREIDMLSSAVQTPGRAGTLAFTKPYIAMPLVIFTRNAVPYVAGLKELEGKKVAVVKGYVAQEWLAKDFPRIKLVPAASIEDMFRLLEKGRVYACIENLPTAGYYLGKPEYSGIKVSGQTPYTYRVSMAVRGDYGLFAGILQKAFEAIPPQQRAAGQRKWMAVAHEHVLDYGLLWKVVIPLLLVLIVFAYWTWRLFREVGSRKLAEARLRDTQKNLEQINFDLDARVRQRTSELEQATHTLRESEARFRKLAEATPVAIMIYQNERWVYTNPAGESISGYTAAELYGMHIWDFVHPDYKDLIRNRGRQRLQGEEIPRYEFKIVSKAGDERWVELTGMLIDFNGAPAGIIAVHDITERKRAESEISQAHDFLQNIFKASPEAIIVTDAYGYIIMANESVYDVYGYRAEELVGQHVSVFAPDDDAMMQKTFTMMEELFEKGIVHNFMAERRHKDGHIIQTESSIVQMKNADGTPAGGISSSRDISERKRFEEQLRQALDYFETIFRTSPDAIFVTDAEGYIVKANESFYSVYGYHPEEIIGQHAAVLTPEDEKAQQTSVALMEELFEKGIVRNFSGERQRKDGRIIQVESSAVLLKSPDGTPTGAISSSRDITDRKRIEEQLRQSQKMEAVGTLAGGIAHDFNNILGVIFGYAELSQDLAAGNSVLANNLEQILKAADRAKNLVSQILAFSRKSESDVKPLRAHLVIKEALKLLRASLPSTISIITDIEDTHDIVVADATQLHQIIMNLCTNAAYAMQHSGGTLEVKLKPVALDEHTVKSYTGIAPGPYAQLSVRDTGTGMPADIIDRIFEPFFTTKDVGRGTGMGLSVVHGIVKSLKGDIKVYSEHGRGTVFHVLLPRIEAAIPESSRDVHEAPPGHESVLLIDDEAVLLDVGTHMLESLGYRVTALQSPQEALEIFKKNPESFDVVITDQTMPGLTGYELARELMLVRPDLPIILCTGYSDLVTAESALAGGIKAFVIKPLNRLAIAETIRKALDTSTA